MKKIIIILSVSLFSFMGDQQKLSNEDYQKLSEEEKRSVKHALDGIDLLDPELEISLFASEPMMSNPTNMDIDHKGRVWICEAYNYRNALNPRNPYNKKGDRILILEDTNGDGKADKSTVFYQGEDINAALGIAVLGNKVYVSCSPNVFVFTDEDGDDIPEKKEILFSGIGGKQHDHGMHAVIFGPDGKLYFNYGNEGKGLLTKDGNPYFDDLGNPIKAEGKPYREGMVYRSDFNGENLEILAWNFRNNYELCLDSYGRMWQSDNDDDGNRSTRINYVMDYGNYGFKDEMTGADWRVRRTNMEDSVFHKHWHLNDPGVVPNLLQTYAGSPTGILLYEGTLLPKKYQNQMIHCDAGPNIVRAYPVKKQGAGFSAEILNILDGSKKDRWFRPSDITVAPDGSLFVSDWYDPGVGGHAMGDSLRGRIYRIAPKNHKYKAQNINLDTPENAAKGLMNPNQAIRFLAYQKLKSFGSKAENELKNYLQHENPAFAARAYWLLSEINSLYIEHASKSENEDIRVLAVRMARKNFKNAQEFYLEMANDPSYQVKREIALAIRHKKATDVWVALAKDFPINDRWYLEALGIAANNNWDASLEALRKIEGDNWLNKPYIQELVWRSRGNHTPKYLGEIIKNKPIENRAKYYRAFDFQISEDKNNVLLDLIAKSSNSNEKVMIFKHFDSKSIRENPKFKIELPKILKEIKSNLDFIEIVEKYDVKNQYKRLQEIALNSADRNEYQMACKVSEKIHGTKGILEGISNQITAKIALERYGDVDTKPITQVLISYFQNSKNPIDLRKIAMQEMGGWNSEETLWTLYKAGKVPEDLKEIAKSVLKRTWNNNIKEEVNKTFAEEENLKSLNFEKILSKSANLIKGKEIYETYCSTCHLVNKEGIDFGPSLGQIGSKLSKQALLNAVLNPSEGISFGYEGHLIELKDGNSFQAIVTSKTENDMMIKYPGQSNINIVKIKDVKKTTQLSESLMPKFPLNETELADLVGYLEKLK